MKTLTQSQQLVEKLRHYNAAYRIGRPEISDAEYDSLVEQLRQLEPDNPWLHQVEPAPVSQNRKRRLPIPMKSLNKVKSIHELEIWLSATGTKSDDLLVITPKFDGLSLLRDEATGIVYSRGGAENEGQDCTAHYKAMRHYPITAPRLADYTFGEFVFSKEYWQKYFEGRLSPDTGEPYKSPRNTAAGMINRDKPVLETVFVDFFRYGVDEGSLHLFDSYTDLYKSLCEHYKQSTLMWQIQASDLSDDLLMHIYEQFSQQYYIDGLVIYINDLDKWEKLGRHEGTGNPRYAIAYKNPSFNTLFETTVVGIEWKVSKAGAMKPVVQIEAVNTGDCVMENPTGYNAAWIKNNNIAPNAKILVTRSGGVIPKIVSTIKSGVVELPTTCPDCGEPLQWAGPELVCLNPNCPGQILAKMIFFFKTVGVENIGEEMFTKLFDNGFKSISSILNITEREIISIDGFGDGIAEIIIREMSKIKAGVPLTTLMHSSDCFKGIGKTKADKLLSGMSPEALEQFINGEYHFPSIEGNVSVTVLNFRAGYKPFIHFLDVIDIPVILPTEQSSPTSDKFCGMNICFSGIRDAEIEAKIKDGGGTLVSGVSKKTTLLIVKDIQGTSSKIEKAKQLGIPIQTIEQFRAQV